jgi:hypothetical protein
VAFDPASLNNENSDIVRGEQVLPSRLFEGAAGGAVIIGSAPRGAEFESEFGWADAVIDLGPDLTKAGRILDALDAQSERIERIRVENIKNCLLRHDWCYRWEKILSSIGLEPKSGLLHRKRSLESTAKRTFSIVQADASSDRIAYAMSTT